MTAYTCLWEFIVEPEYADEFARLYGPNGSWVELFRQAPGYIQTLLLCDSTDPRRFVTIDRWKSAEAYRRFRSDLSQEYADLDRRCTNLTVQETLLGTFDEPIV
jgi:heme-degrading monooxygenase HmoA